MGIFSSKNKDGSLGTNLGFVDGTDYFFKGEAVELSFYEDDNEVRVRSRIDKKKPIVHLKLDKITNVKAITEKEIVEKSKSVGGRAVVGGLVLGPLGAIVGGISGVGDKKKAKTKNYIVVNYKSNDEDKVLSFEIVGASLGWVKVLKEINSANGDLNKYDTDIEL